MSSTSRRVLISCVIISIVVILCVGLIGLAGIGIYKLYPPNAAEQVVTEETSQLNLDTPKPATQDPDLQPAEPNPDQGYTGQSTTQAPAPESTLPAEVISQMDTIQAQVVDLRGLQPLADVELNLLSPEELREQVMTDFLEDYSTEDARLDAVILAAFGLLDPQFNLYELYIELYSEQIIGYFDTDTKGMYVIQGASFSAPERLTYAHEFTHALQDQHYQIEDVLRYEQEYCETDTEYCAAVLALLEGDASLLELQWLYKFASSQDIQEIQEYYTGYESPVFESAPSFLQEDFLFPYYYGYIFVESIHQAGGWSAVDQVYAHPPVSTEQILHPERYPDVTPVLVELPDMLPFLEGSWQELDRNVLGEWYTYLLLAEPENKNAKLDPEDAQQAADGWAGDIYVIYHQEITNQTILILKTIWKNEAEARQFSEAFQEYAGVRFDTDSTLGNEFWSWKNDQEYSDFSLNGNTTTWVIAPNADLADLIRTNLESD